MATGRLGTTPALGFRWSKAPAGGTTSLSGLDDNSVGLTYTPGNERVYRNGVLLSRGNDYTATSGNTITLEDATITGDIIEVFSQELTQLADTIAKSQFTAAGQILTATAASTPAVLPIGTAGQVLQVNSGATAPEWGTISAGGLTEIASGSMAGVDNLLISAIPGTYKHLQLVLTSLQNDDTETIFLRFNDDSTANRYLETTTGDAGGAFTLDKIRVAGQGSLIRTDSPYMNCVVFIPNYANTTSWKISDSIATSESASVAGEVRLNRILGAWNQTSAISSLRLTHTRSGNTFTSGTYALYGVK